MSGMCIEPIMAKHVFAYNCDKASFGIDQNLTSLFKNSYAHSHAEHSHVPFFSYIHHSLRTSDVFYAHNTYGNKTTDTVYVRHHDNIYFLKCKAELVTIIKTDKCFANQIVRVLDGNGNEKYMNQDKFLINYATVIDCKPGTVLEMLLQKIEDVNIINQGTNGLTFALYKNNKYLDMADMLNNEAANHLIWIEERAMNNDTTNGTIWTNFMVLFRQHSVKIQIANMVFKYALEFCLVIIGLFLGLPPIKALSLASTSIKKWIDFKSYVSQNKLYKEALVMKFHREKLGRPKEVDLSKLTAMHFEAIYGSLLDLTDRCALLEDVVNKLATKRDAPTTPTPSQTTTSLQSSKSHCLYI